MHPKDQPSTQIFTQTDVRALVERIEEVLQIPPKSLEKVEAIQVTLTRLDVTIIPKC